LNPNNLTLSPTNLPLEIGGSIQSPCYDSTWKNQKSIDQQNTAVLLQNKSGSACLTENGQGKNNYINSGRKITWTRIAFNKGVIINLD